MWHSRPWLPLALKKFWGAKSIECGGKSLIISPHAIFSPLLTPISGSGFIQVTHPFLYSSNEIRKPRVCFRPHYYAQWRSFCCYCSVSDCDCEIERPTYQVVDLCAEKCNSTYWSRLSIYRPCAINRIFFTVVWQVGWQVERNVTCGQAMFVRRKGGRINEMWERGFSTFRWMETYSSAILDEYWQLK